jgi:hypothetical protein
MTQLTRTRDEIFWGTAIEHLPRFKIFGRITLCVNAGSLAKVSDYREVIDRTVAKIRGLFDDA